MLLLFIRMITCFLNGLFVVILIFGLSLPWLLIIFWIFLIFLTWRFGKISLILRTSLIVVVSLNTWAYNLFRAHLVILKYLEIFFIFLRDLAEIRENSLLIFAGLSVLFFFIFPVLTGLVLEVNLDTTFCLKELLFSLVKSKSQPELYIEVINF